MTPVTITTTTRFTAEVRGQRAGQLLRRANVPHVFDHSPPSGGAACWTCPAARVPDVVAASEMTKHLRVVVVAQQEALLW